MAKFGRAQARKTSTKVRYPRVTIPRVSRGTRNPPGWGSTEVSIRGRGRSGFGQFKRPEPAGEPPPWFLAQYPNATKPEWAVYYGCMRNGLQDGEDFTFRASVGGAGAGYYSQIDFYIPDYSTGIEVQGRYWHLGQGSRKIITDIMRVDIFAQQGVKVIFIDEEHALTDPQFYVKEALAGRDHSHVATGRRAII